MAKTNKNISFHNNRIEQRESRLKTTRQFILAKNLSGLLNNHKWFEIFDWLQSEKNILEIKLLLSGNTIAFNTIYELESSSLLIDHSGNFIEFFEIEFLFISKSNEVEKFLSEQKIDYSIHSEKIRIDGYR